MKSDAFLQQDTTTPDSTMTHLFLISNAMRSPTIIIDCGVTYTLSTYFHYGISIVVMGTRYIYIRNLSRNVIYNVILIGETICLNVVSDIS